LWFKTMKPIYLKRIKEKDLQRIKKRSFGKKSTVSAIVQKIIRDVEKNRDEALFRDLRKWNINVSAIAVERKEIKLAYSEVDNDFIQAVKQARKNIRLFCVSQKENINCKPTVTEKGITVWTRFVPIQQVGIYVPGGNAIYPSSILMTGIPAIIAGCEEIIVCTPPGKNGKIPPPTLVAADMIGIKKIYKMGGAAAIAAMTYGTETIPSVSKIFGAGNSYVTEAKMQVFGKVAIDMPAGPSEVFVIADQTANPAFIAADLLADAEHGPDSACVLVTTSQRIAEETARQIKIQIKTLATKEWIKKSLRKYGLLAVVMTLDEAIDFANGYAPEHLEIMTKNPEQIAMKIKNAGSVFLGPWTTKSAGDYATGANHVLPTGGMAKMFAPLSIESFGRKIEFQKVANKKALGRIAQSIEVFGRVEKLPAHANATSIRFKKL
jgi:histidinol dehydrogenase